MVAANDEKLVMSIPEAGALLGKGRRKSYELAKKGVFPTLKLGSRTVVPKDRFFKWLNDEGNTDND